MTIHSDSYKVIKALKTTYQGITKYLTDKSNLIAEATSLLIKMPLQIDVTWLKSHYTGPDWIAPQDLNKIAHSQANGFLCTDNVDYRPGPTVIDPSTQEVIVQFDCYSLTRGIASRAKITLPG